MSVEPKTDLNGLSARQTVALPLLASGLTTAQVAERVGVVEGTVNNWRCDEEFKAALSQLHQQAFEDAQNDLRSLSLTATGVVREILADPKTPARDRLAAARAVLTFATADPPNAMTKEDQLVRSIADLLKQSPL